LTLKQRAGHGRGALCGPRSLIARTGGAHTRANAGMSSVIDVRTIDTESLRVPGQRQSSQGQSGPKPRTIRRRRWQAGQIILHQSGSLGAKRGRGRAGEPSEWTGWVASTQCGGEANPPAMCMTAGTSARRAHGSHVFPSRREKPLARARSARTAHRHR
jgi:hypothetical protein